MFLWLGVELLSCVQATRKGTRNNILHRVLALGADTATMQPSAGEGEGG